MNHVIPSIKAPARSKLVKLSRMNRVYGAARYTTEFAEDRKIGCATLELYHEVEAERRYVGKIIFWDASGQFFLEAGNAEIPLDILEDLVAEAKSVIKTV